MTSLKDINAKLVEVEKILKQYQDKILEIKEVKKRLERLKQTYVDLDKEYNKMQDFINSAPDDTLEDFIKSYKKAFKDTEDFRNVYMSDNISYFLKHKVLIYKDDVYGVEEMQIDDLLDWWDDLPKDLYEAFKPLIYERALEIIRYQREDRI